MANKKIIKKKKIVLRTGAAYQQAFETAITMSEKHDVQVVAGTYIAIALRLYRTALDEDEFFRLVKFILHTDVNPYDIPTLH
jgi:hypothetical protein|tara:strand:+ start:1766 stop:2011 length:246 start_codon:yes stop_codon:yes gene_type:complete